MMKWRDILLTASSILFGFFLGTLVASHKKPQPQEAGPVYYSTREFCSVDGKVWFPTRNDGMCYAADIPKGEN